MLVYPTSPTPFWAVPVEEPYDILTLGDHVLIIGSCPSPSSSLVERGTAITGLKSELQNNISNWNETILETAIKSVTDFVTESKLELIDGMAIGIVCENDEITVKTLRVKTYNKTGKKRDSKSRVCRMELTNGKTVYFKSGKQMSMALGFKTPKSSTNEHKRVTDAGFIYQRVNENELPENIEFPKINSFGSGIKSIIDFAPKNPGISGTENKTKTTTTK